MLYGRLWYMLKEMNLKGQFEVVTLTIDENVQAGTVEIINVPKETVSKWEWDKEERNWKKIE